MDETGEWSLAPGYDITHAHNPSSQWTFQHLMGVDGKFEGITRNDLLVFAERNSVPRAKAIIGEVNDAVGSWPEFAVEAGLTRKHIGLVGNDHLAL